MNCWPHCKLKQGKELHRIGAQFRIQFYSNADDIQQLFELMKSIDFAQVYVWRITRSEVE